MSDGNDGDIGVEDFVGRACMLGILYFWHFHLR